MIAPEYSSKGNRELNFRMDSETDTALLLTAQEAAPVPCLSGKSRRNVPGDRRSLDCRRYGPRSRGGKLNRLAPHLAFGQSAALRYLFYDVAVAVADAEIHLAVNSAVSSRRTCSTTLIVSTNSRQSIASKKPRLPMLLLIET